MFELVEGSGAEGVGADHGGFESAALVVVGVFGDGGGFAGALESDEEDDVGFASFECVGFDYFGSVVVVGGAAGGILVGGREHGGEFVHDGSLDQFVHVHGIRLVIVHQIGNLFLNVGTQLHDQFDIDVGFDEGAGYFGEEGIEGFGGESGGGGGRGGLEFAERVAEFSAQFGEDHGYLVIVGYCYYCCCYVGVVNMMWWIVLDRLTVPIVR